MTKAPTIVAKIRGYAILGFEAITAYASLEKGDSLLLIREPDNPVDGNAILLERPSEASDDHLVGYVDRDSARQLSPWIDKGWAYVGEIVREPCLTNFGFLTRLDPTPEAEVKCTPVPPFQLKQKRKAHAPV